MVIGVQIFKSEILFTYFQQLVLVNNQLITNSMNFDEKLDQRQIGIGEFESIMSFET